MDTSEALHTILTKLPKDTPKTTDELSEAIRDMTGHRPNKNEFWRVMKEVRKAFPNLISNSYGYQKTDNFVKKLKANNKRKRHIKNEQEKIVQL